MDAETLKFLVQAGFAGLVAVFVWQSIRREDRMSTRLDNVEDRSVTVIESNTKAITELSLTLKQRPCLRKLEEN